jgi:transposase
MKVKSGADGHEELIWDRNAAQKHAWRASIILLSADGAGTAAIMRQTGKSKTCVWRWQERYMAAGVDGLLRDKARPSRLAPLKPDVIERVVALTLTDPPGETTHWTAAMMATASGISASAVRRIWKAHGLQPHRYRQFKLSNDPKFADKLHDVVGLYVDPPAHAIVLSFDEKSQIQALDRTQPGLPMKKGRLGTMTHDYKRNGTTTLFAALNILDGTVIGRNMQQHRHQEFIRFLNTINASVPTNKAVHVKPLKINTDKAPTCGPAIAVLKREGKLAEEVVHRQVMYLNNVLEADHGKLKKLIKPVRGFKTLKTAYATINNFEVVHALRKGQAVLFQYGGGITGPETRVVTSSVWKSLRVALDVGERHRASIRNSV